MWKYVKANQKKTVVDVVRSALLPGNNEMSTNTFSSGDK